MSSEQQEKNKRIAKNTMLLYVRTIVILLISLYTSRVVLDVLGDSDFGLNNVVGGVVAMFAFLNASMTTSTQRFLTLYLGKGDKVMMRNIFAASMNIYIALSIVVVVLSEVVGLWFIDTQLTIPPDRLEAAHWVFHFALASLVFNMTQVPYNSLLIAHERMGVFAYMCVLDAVLRLAIVFVIKCVCFDKLITYAFLGFIATLVMLMCYRFYCYKHLEECRCRLFWDKQIYRDLSGFAGWNLFGSVAWILKDQGVNSVLNIFSGTTINAARAVAVKISQNLSVFVSNFTVAINPQITKSFANGDIDEMESLTYRGLKFSFFLLFFLSLPLMMSVDFVLDIWLVDVPQFTSVFVVLIIVDGLVNNLFGSSVITSLMATGNISKYQICVSSVILLVVPVGYLLMKLGYGPISVFYETIVFTFLSGVLRYWFAVKQIGYVPRLYVRGVLVPVLMVVSLSLPLPAYLRFCVFDALDVVGFFVISVVSVVCVSASVFFFGLSISERDALVRFIKNKLAYGKRG